MSRDEAIRIDRLTRWFGGVTAVDGLSLDLPAGSVFPEIHAGG